MFTHILMAYDGSPNADHVLDDAIDIAVERKAKLLLANVIEVQRYIALAGYGGVYSLDAIDSMRGGAQTILKQAAARAVARGVETESVVLEGEAVDEILRAAHDQKCDLIALGTQGRSGLSRLMLGSIAEGVLRRSDVPLYIRRASAKDTKQQ
ncbi:MAG: universal stress protein [Candidatus Eremiobacteraeota bacterium]|nr:universal stress protein [Candidatus Eremiobacteraeota bacterium]NNM92256.1 universal stress protein [Candidatus Eremiobacteraeota bacterium]